MDEQAGGESPKSEALQIFEENVAKIHRLVKLMESLHGHVFAPTHDAVQKLIEMKGEHVPLTASGLSSPMADLLAAFEKVTNFVGPF